MCPLQSNIGRLGTLDTFTSQCNFRKYTLTFVKYACKINDKSMIKEINWLVLKL